MMVRRIALYGNGTVIFPYMVSFANNAFDAMEYRYNYKYIVEYCWRLIYGAVFLIITMSVAI